MDRDVEIYLKNVVRRWKREANNADKVFIFSPYITSRTAETVTAQVSNNACEIYTLFSSELFINQSSSIKTLINLKKKGYLLYSLPALHAKIVLVPGVFASIGSQNLTTRGAKNLEATVILNGEKIINDVYLKTSQWTVNRIEITLAMLLDMEELIKPYLASYKLILDGAKNIDLKIKENENRRLQQQQAIIKSRREKLNNLRKSILKSSKARESVIGEVKKIEPSWDSYSSGTYSFIPNIPANLTEWVIEDKILNLRSTNRYICLIEDNGKLGWARVVKTRLTYFASGVSRTENTILGESQCKVEYSAIWDTNEGITDNLIITIHPTSSNAVIVCKAWFGLDTLTINGIKVDGDKDEDALRIIKLWIKNNPKEFVEHLRNGLLSPFKYQKKLLGVEANQFFGTIGKKYQIRVVSVNDIPVLLARKYRTAKRL